MSHVARVYRHFYATPRISQLELSDGGGPFGSDVTLALEVDWLLNACGCDAVIEAGCHFGDTTDYLTRAYRSLPVHACDIDEGAIRVTSARLKERSNLTILHMSSPRVVAEMAARYRRPFFYLDAHWGETWPLHDEIKAIKSGVACIHDFDIGHHRFGFDEYDGVRCGPDVLSPWRQKIPEYFINDHACVYPLPCLQVGRRSGRAYFAVGISSSDLMTCPYLVRRATLASASGAR